VKKTGDATVLLVGFPSVGKSTIINALTNADSKTGAYDFTTTGVIPGMLDYNGAKIQILDIPGIIAEAASGKGMGKRVLSMVRSADLILIIVDKVHQAEVIKRELYNSGFRLDRQRPDVRINRKDTGGLSINIAVRKAAIDKETVRQVLSEFKIHNADVIIRENITPDMLIDCMMKNRLYVPSLVVLNKMDRLSEAEMKIIPAGTVAISASKKMNLEKLKAAIWNKLGLSRIYLKRVGRDPDMREPLIMKTGCTVMNIAEKILRNHSKYLKYARIWGPSARFPEQKVGPEHRLRDGDIVELHA
jgi:small GTP-binding protein